jgi:hypothetical protein
MTTPTITAMAPQKPTFRGRSGRGVGTAEAFACITAPYPRDGSTIGPGIEAGAAPAIDTFLPSRQIPTAEAATMVYVKGATYRLPRGVKLAGVGRARASMASLVAQS